MGGGWGSTGPETRLGELHSAAQGPSSNSTFCLLLKESSPAVKGKGCFHMVSLAFFFTWVNVGHVLSKIKTFLNQ